MLGETKNINDMSLAGESNQFVLIDKQGNIIDISPDLEHEFQRGTNIFDLLDTADRKRLSDPIMDEAVDSRVLHLKRRDNSTVVSATVQILRKDKQTLFKLNIQKILRRNERNTLKVDLFTENIENKLPGNVQSLIDNIRSTYPFTIIGKAKIQRLIDEYEGFFWVINANGTIEIINENFADFLGEAKDEIEGNSEKDVFPEYMSKIFIDTRRQILESKSNVLLVDNSGSLFLNHQSLKEIVHIPILDIDDNVVAIIAFTVKNFEPVGKESDVQLSTQLNVSDWSVPVILADNNGGIISYSQTAYKLVLENFRSPNLLLYDFFDDESSKKIKGFFDSGEKSLDFTTNLNSRKLRILVQKIYNSDLQPLALIYITPITREELKTRDFMFEKLLQNYALPAFIYNIENLKFLDVNEEALRLYGYTREEFLSMDLTDLYAPEDIQSLIEMPDKNAGKKNIPMRQKCKDGSFIIVEIINTEIDYKGVHSHFSVIKDITNELELNKKLQLYKTAFDNSADPIVITDIHGFVKFINGAFTEKFGYSKAEIEQNPISSILTDAYRGKINSALFQSEYPEERKMEVEVKTSSDSVLKAEIIGTPIFGFQEKVERFSLIFKLEESEKIITADSSSELSKKEIDSSFLSNLFHELLTPLNVIIGFVQELSESIENPNEEQREAIQIIDENQKVLLQTMDIAVEYSHLEQDYVNLAPEKVKFVDLLQSVEDATKKSVASSEVDLTYGKVSSSLQFETDVHKFTTFLTQMVNFALIMTHESEIYISGNFYEENKFVIGIKDSKGGISEELMNNLRSVFHDDEINIRKNFGLSRFTVRLVRKLLEILHGEIRSIPSAANPKEFGIVFPLKLEVPESHLEQEMLESVISENEMEDISVAEEITEEPPVVPPVVPQPKPEPKEINLSSLSCLYVEDQVDSQILFKVQMKELKSMEFANSFEKALPLLRSKKFDFIVMDINLQGEYNGLDALKIIKKMPGYENVPIIAVTAYVVPGAAEKFIQAGFSAFVNKPLLREKIIDALKKIF